MRPLRASVPIEIPRVSWQESPSHQYSSTSAIGAAHLAVTSALPGQQPMLLAVHSPDGRAARQG